MSVNLRHAALMFLSAALVGCGESSEPTVPPPNATPAPGASATAPSAAPSDLNSGEPAVPATPATPTAPSATPADANAGGATAPATGEAAPSAKPGDSNAPEIVEEPAAPTETPADIKEAPEKGAGEVKKEEPPKGA